MHHRDGHIVNYVNATQFAAQMFGGLENLITLSLSQVLTYNSLYIIKLRGHPRQYTAFFASVQPMEQREKSQARLCSSESRQRSSIAQGKPKCFLS